MHHGPPWASHWNSCPADWSIFWQGRSSRLWVEVSSLEELRYTKTQAVDWVRKMSTRIVDRRRVFIFILIVRLGKLGLVNSNVMQPKDMTREEKAGKRGSNYENSRIISQIINIFNIITPKGQFFSASHSIPVTSYSLFPLDEAANEVYKHHFSLRIGE